MAEADCELPVRNPDAHPAKDAVDYQPMTNSSLSHIAIAIASDSLQQRTTLRRYLAQAGLNVVLSEPLTRLFLRKLESSEADVVLLDLHDDVETDEDLLHEVLDKVQIPVIFNDITAITLNESTANSKWHISLMNKIAELQGIQNWSATAKQEQKNGQQIEEPKSKAEQAIASNVWVLGSSLGGPEALKRFLKAVPADIPAAFVIAQHLGENFTGLLAEQLNRISRLKVMVPKKGHLLLNGEVIIAPVDERVRINPIGNIELEDLPYKTNYTPSIDMVISDIAIRYGKRSGAIIFTGMGDDGKKGCREMVASGGRVWLQSTESCVISSMPDNVKQVCNIDFVANPETLALQLAKDLHNQAKSALHAH